MFRWLSFQIKSFKWFLCYHALMLLSSLHFHFDAFFCWGHYLDNPYLNVCDWFLKQPIVWFDNCMIYLLNCGFKLSWNRIVFGWSLIVRFGFRFYWVGAKVYLLTIICGRYWLVWSFLISKKCFFMSINRMRILVNELGGWKRKIQDACIMITPVATLELTMT